MKSAILEQFESHARGPECGVLTVRGGANNTGLARSRSESRPIATVYDQPYPAAVQAQKIFEKERKSDAGEVNALSEFLQQTAVRPEQQAAQ
jgi:hypothetical protein